MKQEFNYFAFNECASAFKILGLDMDLTEYSTYLEENALNHNQIEAIDDFLYHLRDKKVKSTIEMYLKTSRLPFKVPKTFANFDFNAIKGKHVDRLKTLSDLNAIRAHKNIAFIGPPGTGKTHLAQAYGYECCQNGFKTYFIKMSELRDKFTIARRNGKEAS